MIRQGGTGTSLETGLETILGKQTRKRLIEGKIQPCSHLGFELDCNSHHVVDV